MIHCSATQLTKLDDSQLLERLRELLKKDQCIEAAMLLHIAEVDRRKLFREHACSSMYRFCLDELHLSEAMSYRRIHVARAASKFPRLLDKIESGELHLTGAALLVPHLKADNSHDLIEAAVHKSKRQIEKMLAEKFPAPDVPATIRKLPNPNVPNTPPSNNSSDSRSNELLASQTLCVQQSKTCADRPQHPAEAPAQAGFPTSGADVALNNQTASQRQRPVTPLSGDRFKIQFTADEKLMQNIEKAKDLLGPNLPQGDLASLFDRAVQLLVDDLEKRKHGKSNSPRTEQSRKSKDGKSKSTHGKAKSRYIPREVRRRVYERDGGQCAYVNSEGKRCKERWGLEYHHRLAYALGGEATEANVELRCRGHNCLAAEEDFGVDRIRSAQRRKDTGLVNNAKAQTNEGRGTTEVRENRPSYLTVAKEGPQLFPAQVIGNHRATWHLAAGEDARPG